MQKNYSKRDMLNFMLCYVSSISCTVLLDKFFIKRYSDGTVLSAYVLLMVFPVLLLSALIYFSYLFSTRYIVKKLKSEMFGVFLLILWSSFYLLLVLKIEWAFSKDQYQSFYEYIRDLNNSIIFSTIAIIQIDISLTRRSLKTIF